MLKTGPGIGLRRRSSAYAGSKSRNVSAFTGQDAQSKQHLEHQHSSPSTPSAISSTSRSRFGMLNARAATEGSTPSGEGEDTFGSGGGGLSRNQPRSRSLIRRVSRKAKQQVRDASSGAGGNGGERELGDCRVS